jgi:hypothetical protein
VYNGALCLFDVVAGVDHVATRVALSEFGNVVSCEDEEAVRIVRFTTHEEALQAKRAAPELTNIAAGIDTLYNERSYDGRSGEDGREDDGGRGWCASTPPGHPDGTCNCSCRLLSRSMWRAQVRVRVGGEQ